MEALAIAMFTLVLAFGGAIFGIFLRAKLPHGHLAAESSDVVKIVVGLTATLTAVLLSLLISSAKTFYDGQTHEVEEIASKVILLDRILSVYGPEAGDARTELRRSVTLAVDMIWPRSPSAQADLALPQGREAPKIYNRLLELSPHTDAQKIAQSQAIQIALALGEIRFLMYAQRGNAVPTVFLAVLMFWVVVLFGGYGLLTKVNATMVAILLVAAFSISSAIYLIIEFNDPYGGTIGISDKIMRDAIAQIGRA